MTPPKGVYKKRKFKGNQHTLKVVCLDPETSSRPSPSQPIVSSRPMPTPPSSSRIKLSTQSNSYNEYKGDDRNIIISMAILSDAIREFAVCRVCRGELRLLEIEERRNGLACQLSLSCLKCDRSNAFWTSSECKPNPTEHYFEINMRLFYGLRCIGKGGEGGKVLCGMLNLPRPSTAYTKYTKTLRHCVSLVAEQSMIQATREAVIENDNCSDISIAFDGTWQKRGFRSKNGCCTITSIDTGKVLDVEVLTKFCSGCTKIDSTSEDYAQKVEAHQGKCLKNYEGSSGGMESASAVTLFGRSVEKRGVRYKEMLGDGDSKAFLAVVESDPYDDLKVSKIECVNHVAKRMGSRLRATKLSCKKKTLSDGKSIRSRLSDKKIDELQAYYSSAIRNNCTDLKNMQRAVWAIYFHKISTDKSPHHGLCPKPPDTWCRYWKAQEKGELAIFKHKNSIPVAVMEVIKHDFQHLAKPELLKRCLHGKTQNVNEAFNHVIWNRLPKNVFVGRLTLELGVYEAVISFNEGNVSRLKVLKELGFSDYGEHTITAMKSLDAERVRSSDRVALQATKDARLSKKRASLLQEPDDPMEYAPGAF